MAIAERFLAARFNRPSSTSSTTAPGPSLSDGDLMEGVATRRPASPATCASASSTRVYDDNHITIDGTPSSHSPRTSRKRFSAYGWRVLRRRRRQRPQGDPARARRRRVAVRPPHADPPAHHHRRTGAHQAEHPRGPRRAARRRRDGQATKESCDGRGSRSTCRPRSMPSERAMPVAAAGRNGPGASCSMHTRRSTRPTPPTFAPGCRVNSRPAGTPALPDLSGQIGARHPPGLAGGARCHRQDASGPDRRLRRPGGMQRHQHQGRRDPRPPHHRSANCTGASASTAWRRR